MKTNKTKKSCKGPATHQRPRPDEASWTRFFSPKYWFLQLCEFILLLVSPFRCAYNYHAQEDVEQLQSRVHALEKQIKMLTNKQTQIQLSLISRATSTGNSVFHSSSETNTGCAMSSQSNGASSGSAAAPPPPPPPLPTGMPPLPPPPMPPAGFALRPSPAAVGAAALQSSNQAKANSGAPLAPKPAGLNLSDILKVTLRKTNTSASETGADSASPAGSQPMGISLGALQSVKLRKTQPKECVSPPPSRSVSFAEMARTTLRKSAVLRSPGGTPFKAQTSVQEQDENSSPSQSNTSFISTALRRRFQHVRVPSDFGVTPVSPPEMTTPRHRPNRSSTNRFLSPVAPLASANSPVVLMR